MEIISLIETPLDYLEGLRLQEDCLARRIANETDDTIISLQHTHVYTLGRLGNSANLLADLAVLEKEGIRVLRTGRGGDITYHGPGQVVLYPVFRLKRIGNDLHKYLRLLEDAALETLKEYGITGQKIPGKTGVFVQRRKIASIGIGVKRWVSYHGISLNVGPDLAYFDRIVPCGLQGVQVTSMKQVTKKPLCIETVSRTFIASLCEKWLLL